MTRSRKRCMSWCRCVVYNMQGSSMIRSLKWKRNTRSPESLSRLSDPCDQPRSALLVSAFRGLMLVIRISVLEAPCIASVMTDQ